MDSIIFEGSARNTAVKRAVENGQDKYVVIRYNKKYCTADRNNLPEGCKIVWQDGEFVKGKITQAKLMETGKHITEKTGKSFEEAIAEPEYDEEERVTAVDMAEGESETVTHQVELPEDSETEAVDEIDPAEVESLAATKRLPRVIVRQTEPNGCVTVGTIDLRQKPDIELVSSIKDLDSCLRVIETGGGCHAYPLDQENWADLMNGVIELTEKTYPSNEYEVRVDRIH